LQPQLLSQEVIKGKKSRTEGLPLRCWGRRIAYSGPRSEESSGNILAGTLSREKLWAPAALGISSLTLPVFPLYAVSLVTQRKA